MEPRSFCLFSQVPPKTVVYLSGRDLSKKWVDLTLPGPPITTPPFNYSVTFYSQSKCLTGCWLFVWFHLRSSAERFSRFTHLKSRTSHWGRGTCRASIKHWGASCLELLPTSLWPTSPSTPLAVCGRTSWLCANQRGSASTAQQGVTSRTSPAVTRYWRTRPGEVLHYDKEDFFSLTGWWW